MNEHKPILRVLCSFHQDKKTQWWQKVFQLSDYQVMGRMNQDEQNNIALPSNANTIAAEQGVFFTNDEGTYYQAAPNARNLLYRNGKPLLPGQWYLLADRDVLVVYGDASKTEYVDILFIYAAGIPQNQLEIHIQSKSVRQGLQKKYLLKNIDLSIPSGHMVLVLGGSGAGKTTFMNAVMGYEPADGKIIYNGVDIYQNYSSMKYQIGYVPQEDLLRMNDTVYHTLLDAAKMRLPATVKHSEYRLLVEQTMRMLGLKREEKELVGKLSGGQRKRLSIAVEYIGNPALFFLDEPDSGLDGGIAQELMQSLRTIADQGKIVLVISHNPNRVADLFDDVIVLAKSTHDNCGYLAFYGSTEKACDFFDVSMKVNRDIEGIVTKINRREEGGLEQGDSFIRKFQKERIYQYDN